ncbi:hypothetical protein D3C86_1974440 [compost metagenome]
MFVQQLLRVEGFAGDRMHGGYIGGPRSQVIRQGGELAFQARNFNPAIDQSAG